jgi:ABC-type transport system substrate-binding protein
MSDMEQARLVRWALSYAIDREGIVEQLQSNIGTPIYIEYMGPLYPGWDPNRTVSKAKNDGIIEKYGCSVALNPMPVADCPSYGVDSPLADKEWPWLIPWDPDYAEELLDLAGYPKKNGVRFEIQLNKYACETGDVCLEQADAVGAAWESIGVRTTLSTEDYGAVVSQGMRARIRFYPVVKNCSVESANNPLDWPLPPADSSLTRPGWGCGFEDPFSAYMQGAITNEADKATREEMHLDVVDWMYYWNLYGGVAQQPRGVGYNPDNVKSWNSPASQGPNWYRPEYIVPA